MACAKRVTAPDRRGERGSYTCASRSAATPSGLGTPLIAASAMMLPGDNLMRSKLEGASREAKARSCARSRMNARRCCEPSGPADRKSSPSWMVKCPRLCPDEWLASDASKLCSRSGKRAVLSARACRCYGS